MGGDYVALIRERVRAITSGVRFGMFVSVGVVGALCDTTVLVTLDEGLGVPFEIATLVGIETAILVMFLVNEHWTFADEGADERDAFLSRLKRSHVVRAGGSATQFTISWIVYRLLFVGITPGDVGLWVDLTGALGLGALLFGLDLWLLVAKGSGIAVGMLVNYVFESLFTWRVHLE